MSDTTNGNTPEPSQRKSMPAKISSSMSIGAVAAMFLAGPETWPGEMDSRISLSKAVFGCLGMACLFGVPAGLLLAFRDRSKNVPSAWSAVWSVPGGIFSGAMVLVLLVYGLGEINAFAAFARERLGPGPENSGLSELASMIAGSFWGLALMLLYTSAETLKSKLEPSPPMQIATSVAPETIDGSAQESDAAADNHSQVDSLPTQPADHQMPNTSAKLSLWGLAGAFPFMLAFLIWMAGITRSYNMALEVCFGLTVCVIWLSYVSEAVSSISGNDRYVIRNWWPVVFVVAVGVVAGLSYWFAGDFSEKAESESRSIDLFIVGVWVFHRIKERRARSTRLQPGLLVAKGT